MEFNLSFVCLRTLTAVSESFKNLGDSDVSPWGSCLGVMETTGFYNEFAKHEKCVFKNYIEM